MLHSVPATALCTFLGVGNDPRYTPSSTFETFPFPAGLTPADTKGQPVAEGELLLPTVEAGRLPAAVKIATAAQRLASLRENWLNPAEWVERVPEVVAGYPERIIAKPEYAAELKKRTLTNLYNARPAWLDNAHKALDQAVAEAYGWTDYTPAISDEEILRRLLALNLSRGGQRCSWPAGMPPASTALTGRACNVLGGNKSALLLIRWSALCPLGWGAGWRWTGL